MKDEKSRGSPTCRSCEYSLTERRDFTLDGNVTVSVNTVRLTCSKGKKVMRPNCEAYKELKI